MRVMKVIGVIRIIRVIGMLTVWAKLIMGRSAESGALRFTTSMTARRARTATAPSTALPQACVCHMAR